MANNAALPTKVVFQVVFIDFQLLSPFYTFFSFLFTWYFFNLPYYLRGISADQILKSSTITENIIRTYLTVY